MAAKHSEAADGEDQLADVRRRAGEVDIREGPIEQQIAAEERTKQPAIQDEQTPRGIRVPGQARPRRTSALGPRLSKDDVTALYYSCGSSEDGPLPPFNSWAPAESPKRCGWEVHWASR